MIVSDVLKTIAIVLESVTRSTWGRIITFSVGQDRWSTGMAAARLQVIPKELHLEISRISSLEMDEAL